MPTISLKNDRVPFLLGGDGAITVSTGELPLNSPIPPGTPSLLRASFDASGADAVTLGLQDSVKLAVKTSAVVELLPVFATSEAGVIHQLAAYGLQDFFSRPEHRGRGILCFRTAVTTSATGRGSFRYSALKTTVELEAGVDAGYAFLRPFDPSQSVSTVVAEFFREMRLPEQGNRAPDEGEVVALQYGGYLRLGAEFAAGYELRGTKSFALGQLSLSEQYDLSIIGRIGLSAGVAGRFSILVAAADRPGWARVIVKRNAREDLKIAADVVVGFKNELDLPGTAHEFLGAALGVNAKNFINVFNRALELSDFPTFRAALDGLAQQFVEAMVGRAFDALSAKAEFNKLLALAGRIVKSYEEVEDRAVTLYDRYFDRLEPLTRFLVQIQSLTRDGLPALRSQLDPEQWTMLAQLTDGDPLAFLLDQVMIEGRTRNSFELLNERADAALALLREQRHEDLRRLVATAKQQFGLDSFFRVLGTIDTPDELRSVANERIGLFVRRLVGRPLDSNTNVKEAFKEIRAVLQNIDAFSTKVFTAFKEATNRSYRTALYAEYSRATESDALIAVSINMSTPRGVALLRQAGRGDFEEALTTRDAEVVRLDEGVFTHRTTRRSPFNVNIVGWHRDYQYEGFDRVITETEQRLVPSDEGITVYSTASLALERERRRRDESVHVSFLLRALGESAGVVKSSPKDKRYVVDALRSLAIRYQLSFTDEDTSAMELNDYLAFAQELGLGAQGATLEHLTPLLARQENGSFGAVSASYDVRFGQKAIDALLSVKAISPAAEKAVRRALRQIVLANYLKSGDMHDVAFAYATPGVFTVFRGEGAARFTGHSSRQVAVSLDGVAIAAPTSVRLDQMELTILATLFNIEDALIEAMKNLYKVLGGRAIDLAKFEKALSTFGDAMKLFDDFDQTSRRDGVGTNTVFVVFDQLVRLASKGPSTTASVLHLTSRVGDRTVEKVFLSADAAAAH